MSRIGKKPVAIPDGVKVTLKEGTLSVEGPKGRVQQALHPDIKVTVDAAAKRIVCERPSDDRRHRALHGCMRALIGNMVQGVTQEFQRALEIVGVGYNAKVQGSQLHLNLGFNHPVILDIPPGLKVECPSLLSIVVKGADKHRVGQFAADVRSSRPPSPYPWKNVGIKYTDEVIRKKAGKTFVSGA